MPAPGKIIAEFHAAAGRKAPSYRALEYYASQIDMRHAAAYTARNINTETPRQLGKCTACLKTI